MFRYKIQDLQVSNSQKKSSTSTILIALLVAGSLIAVLTIALSCGKKDVNTKENMDRTNCVICPEAGGRQCGENCCNYNTDFCGGGGGNM